MSETLVVDTSRPLRVDTRRRSSVLELDFIDSGFVGGSDTSIDLLKQHAFGMINTAQLKLRQSVSTSPAVSPLPSNTSSADDKADFLPIGKQQLQQQPTSSDISNILSVTGSLSPPCLWATRSELSPYIRDDVRALSCTPHRQQSVVSNDCGFADEKSQLRFDVAAIKSSLQSAFGNGFLATPEESSLNHQRSVPHQSTNFIQKTPRQNNDASLLSITDTVNHTTETTFSMQPAVAADVSCNTLVNGDVTKSKTRPGDSDEAMTDSEYEALMKKRLQLIFNTYTSPSSSVKKTSQPAIDSRRTDVEKPEVTEKDLLKLREIIMRADITNGGSAAAVEDEYLPLPLSANAPSSHRDNIGGSRPITWAHRNAGNYPPLSGPKLEPTLVNDRSHSNEVVTTTPSYPSAAHLKQPVKDDKLTDINQNFLVGKYNYSEPYFGRRFEMKSSPATTAAVGHDDPGSHRTENSRLPLRASSIFQPTISSSTPSRSFVLNDITAQTGTKNSSSVADYLALPNQEPLYHDVRKSWHSKSSVSPNTPADDVNAAGSRLSSSRSVSFNVIEKSVKDEQTTEQLRNWFDGQQLRRQRPPPTAATTTATRSTSADDVDRQTDFQLTSSDNWGRYADVDSRASWPNQRTRGSIENETTSASYTDRSRCGLDDVRRGVTTRLETAVVPANTGSERYQPDDLLGTSSGSKWPTAAFSTGISKDAPSTNTWLTAGYSAIQSEQLADPMQRLNYLRQRQQQLEQQQQNYSWSIHLPSASNQSTGAGRQWSAQPVRHTGVKSPAVDGRDDSMEFVVLRCGEIVKRPFLNKPANTAQSCVTTGLSSSQY